MSLRICFVLLLLSACTSEVEITIPDMGAAIVRIEPRPPLPVCLGYHPDAGELHVVP